MRMLPILLLFFPFSAFATDIVLPRVFPQQYTDEEAQIKVIDITYSSPDPKLTQTALISAYSDIVNGGKFNIHGIATSYHDGYLQRVQIIILLFPGEGNRLRLAIRIGTEGKHPSQKKYAQYRGKAEYLMRHHPELVPMIVRRLPLCEEILYLEPSNSPGDDSNSLIQQGTSRFHAPGLRFNDRNPRHG